MHTILRWFLLSAMKGGKMQVRREDVYMDGIDGIHVIIECSKITGVSL